MQVNLTKKQKGWIIAGSVLMVIILILSIVMGVAVAKSKKDQTVASGTLSMLGNLIRSKSGVDYQTFGDEALYPVDNFRVSMSAMNHWENGTDYAKYDYTYSDGTRTATDLKSLQEMYNAYGATEMYVRINTSRYYPAETVNDYYHARMHCLEESKKACVVAAELNMPINVELGCFAAYSDAFESQYPDFSEYPELDGVYPTGEDGKWKEWKELTIEEICAVLTAYGKLVAAEIKAIGCDVEYWDLGNETNYGFGGVMMPLESKVSKATSKSFWITYLKKGFGADWLAENIWCYNGQMFAALAQGIKEVYPEAKFSSHISTVTWGPDYTVKYFKTLAENGYKVDQAGISYYPNATGVILDKIAQIKQIVLACNKELGVNVMLAEYGYANESGLASGTFASWDNEVHGYKLTDEDGAKFLKELITWGRKNGMAGIRPWAAELDWANPWFDFDNEAKTATAKAALFTALKEAVA
ncbi:MAG: glycosyl hydrolase 53 family protein [Clostridia bacterium]|nr:glycosyl hydrolase 53 family protein [Clostridia bacterium]